MIRCPYQKCSAIMDVEAAKNETRCPNCNEVVNVSEYIDEENAIVTGDNNEKIEISAYCSDCNNFFRAKFNVEWNKGDLAFIFFCQPDFGSTEIIGKE